MKVIIFFIFASLARLEAKWQPKGRFEGKKNSRLHCQKLVLIRKNYFDFEPNKQTKHKRQTIGSIKQNRIKSNLRKTQNGPGNQLKKLRGLESPPLN